LLGTFHEDYASLRRYLVDEGLLVRNSRVYAAPKPPRIAQELRSRVGEFVNADVFEDKLRDGI
jgi:hypothetical protein